MARYTFRTDEYFYKGHFPGYPITPAVILIEAMNQTALGIWFYRKALETGRQGLSQWVGVFTDANSEVLSAVYPGEQITMRAKRVFWRMNKLRAKVEMSNSKGEVVAFSEGSGVGVRIG